MRLSSEFRKLFSVCAICTVECVLRCADCTVECVTPELSRLGRFAGPGPCGLGLSRMLADGRAAVKTPKTFPPAPPKGGRGELFLHKFSGLFLAKMAKAGTSAPGTLPEFPVNFYQPWGDYRGVLIYQESGLRPRA